MSESTSQKNKWIAAIGISLFLIVFGATVGWAGATVLSPPANPLTSSATVYSVVKSGEVGSSLSLNSSAQWDPSPTGANRSTGTVTTVNVSPGQTVGAGSALYSVDLRPVVILQGSVPAFRDIKAGDKGEDVTQIQAFLSGKGLLGGGNTGVVDAKTTKAIKAWQKSLNEPQDGSIQIGDVIFVPTLPTAIAVDPKLVARGFTLAGGERAINTLGLTPRFSMNVTPQQASLIKAGTRIEISNSTGGVWDAYVAQTRSTVLDANSGGGVSLELVGKDGVPICGADCGSILAGDPQLFTSRVIISEPVNGLTVPTAALRTNADNEIIIVDNHGTNHVVKVLASAQGMSVISGVAAGMKVRLASNG